MGLGNRPNRAESISVGEENILWERQMQTDNPEGLLNAVWYTVNKLCGQRGSEGTRKMCWGDIDLKQDENGNRYLEFNERTTKTRNGANLSNLREFAPTMWEIPNDPVRCPVRIYEEFRKRRPAPCLNDESPFFIGIKHNR